MFLNTYHMPDSEFSSAESMATWFIEFEMVSGSDLLAELSARVCKCFLLLRSRQQTH